jgi:hypothetical protein
VHRAGAGGSGSVPHQHVASVMLQARVICGHGHQRGGRNAERSQDEQITLCPSRDTMSTAMQNTQPVPHGIDEHGGASRRLEAGERGREAEGTRACGDAQAKRAFAAGRRHRCLSHAWTLCALGCVLVLQAHTASAYLVKSHLHWERIGAFPHYVNAPSQNGTSWPYSSYCFNGPACGKNTPDYLCNPACGDPNIGLKDGGAWPKPFLIRFVSSLLSPLSSQEFLPQDRFGNRAPQGWT